MSEKRFVNEKIILQSLPVFPHFPEGCNTEEEKKKHLDRIIDWTEERLILEKAEEIMAKRNEDASAKS